ncbi:hypothetical protein J4464_04890 [Candidatus Woesearchaeota archaeon]|nr:hypothetical protein [Candidatus Woesearchaeota archaeon]
MQKKGFELSINFIVIMILAIVIFGLGIKFVNDFFKQANKLSDKSTEQLDREIGELLCPTNQMVCIPVNRKTIRHGEFDTFGIKIRNVLDKNADFKVYIYPDNDILKPNDITLTSTEIKRLGFTEKDNVDVPLVLSGSYTCVNECVNTNKLFVLPTFKEINDLGINQETEFAIGIEVQKAGIAPGTYVFDVYIAAQEDDDPKNSYDAKCGSVAVHGYPPLGVVSPDPTNAFDYSCVKDLQDTSGCVGGSEGCFDKSKLYGGRIYKLYVEIP